MEKRRLVMVMIAAVGVFGSVALAGGPLGPPKAFVGHGKWLVDVEYAHEEMDLKTCGATNRGFDQDDTAAVVLAWDSVADGYQIEGLGSNMFFGSLAYGLCENWDVFVRLGAADAADDIEPYSYSELFGPPETREFDGGYGFAWGLGTRATVCTWGPWTFGAVGQVTWVEPGDSDVSWSADIDGDTVTVSGKTELDWRQFQAGIGVTYQADGWWVYGGPCWFFVNGDFEFNATETTVTSVPEYYTDQFDGRHDLREESEFGGWVGVGCELSGDMTCYAECQLYSDGWVFGAGVAFPFPAE